MLSKGFQVRKFPGYLRPSLPAHPSHQSLTFFRAQSTLSPYWQPKRYLRMFPVPKTEVVIANNAGLFFTLASLKIHGLKAHPQVRIIMPNFWLDFIDKDFNHLDWGQTLRGLPWYARQEFLEIYPGHDDDTLITWQQFKELRAHVKSELSKFGVRLYPGIAKIQKNKNDYSIETSETTFTVPADSYFYNTYRIPNTEHELGYLAKLSHTDLYKRPLSDAPSRVIVIGGGRSVLWLGKHFPKTIFACIKSAEREFPLFTHENLPPNVLIYPWEAFGIRKREFKITADPVNHHVALIEDLRNQGRGFSGEFYCALGLKPDLDITTNVDSQHLLLHPYHSLTWIGQEEVPPGSLIESTQRWALATGNLEWAYETHCYHEEPFIEAFNREMNQIGICLPFTFFDNLREAILQSHDHPTKKQVPLHSPSDIETVQIYKKCLLKSYEEKFPADKLAVFEAKLLQLSLDRVNAYNSANKDAPRLK